MKLCTAIKSILKMCMCFFAYKNIIFDKITAILTLTFQTLVSTILLNVLRVMGEDGARGKDWLRARGHHLCLTDIIF